MPRGQAAFIVPEYLDRLGKNYGIPYDGEGSDISSEYSEPDIDIDQAVLDCKAPSIDEESEVLDNLHEVELVGERNETYMGRIPAFYGFSKTIRRVGTDSDNESEENKSDGE